MGKQHGRFEIVIEIKALGMALEDPGPIGDAVRGAAQTLAQIPTVECVTLRDGGATTVFRAGQDAVVQLLLYRGRERLARIYEEGDEKTRNEIEQLLALEPA